MIWFVRQSNKVDKVCAFSQYHISKICDNIFKCISKELNVNGNVFESIRKDIILKTS